MAQHGAATYQFLPPEYGPFSAHFLAGGEGLEKTVPATDPLLKATTPWTMTAWVEMPAVPTQPMLIAGVGDAMDEQSRFFAVIHGRLALWFGKDNVLMASTPLAQLPWHFIAATFDGQVAHLYCDGVELATGTLIYGRVAPVVTLAPVETRLPDAAPFGGRIALLTVSRAVMSDAEIAAAAKRQPEFSLVAFEEGAKPWPMQTRGQAGYRAPQDPATLPRSEAPFSAPKAGPAPSAKTTLRKNDDGAWTLSGGWKLAPAPKVTATAEEISKPGFRTEGWWAATVPGTVLTTMVDRGVYPDPDYGLNNLAIPESLNKQDYWYRAEFTAPKQAKGERRTLVLDGINYHAEVWLNGKHIGQVTGAFERGVFDVTDALRTGGANALAIRISPPPHPGIPQEQSILGGPGENGGMMCLDGPTFVATEGWDWIPAERDRDSGLWQDVRLVPSGQVQVGDAQVITALPRLQNGQIDTSQADVAITVPLKNASDEAQRGKLTASFEGVEVSKEITIAPGQQSVELKPAEFPELHLMRPRLWWPNGYGRPELYHLRVTFTEDGATSTVTSQFGVREVTYELSLFDNDGQLRRVEYSPTEDRDRATPAVDVSHDGMREVSNRRGMARAVASIAAGADAAPSLHPDGDLGPAPYLVIKVNGVRIAARGGNWGMDDARKRVSRDHLEPYFRLHRDAGLNIIRNWVGQSTEETFYELADEYGLMVWNDFWDSTQNYNVEAEDPQLFLANAKDTIERYRNHPSIVMWCGRNEGVPQPIINEGLIRLIHSLDGTRYYSPSSNEVNLQGSGPYSYQEPADYYTRLNHGFSVETGTPSLPTREWFNRWIPEADHWPVSDDWAYHDWHQAGNGDVNPFNEHMEAMFGAATNLDDYVRKAQMMNYVDHRAIFEGMNAHLWSPNSGRMLWMTQPAWPSTMWEIFSSDYDTQASYYGVKKACEPVHVQLDLSNDTVAVANTTTEARAGLKLSARVYGLDNKLLLTRDAMVNAAPDAVTPGFPLALAPLIGDDGVVLVRLELRGADGQLVSDNFYWRAAHDAGYRALDRLAAATVTVTAQAASRNEIRVDLRNAGQVAALENKLTLLDGDGSQVLPAYYSDNYVSLLPGEERVITIAIPESAGKSGLRLELRGWNATPLSEGVHP
jgi:hypothetical protein